MTEISHETIRRAYRAFSEGDTETVLALLDESIEWHPPALSVEPEPLRGRDAVRRYLAPDLFASQVAEPQELIERGNQVLVVVRVRARGRESGIEIENTVFHLWTIEKDLAVRFEALPDREQALGALDKS